VLWPRWSTASQCGAQEAALPAVDGTIQAEQGNRCPAHGRATGNDAVVGTPGKVLDPPIDPWIEEPLY
jgi:hypothetical protein